MAAPAAAVAARAAGAAVLDRVRPTLEPPPPPKGASGLLKILAAIAVAVLVLPALIVVVLFGGAQQNADCAPAAGLPGAWTGPGSLGGVAGTGVSTAELTAARAIGGVGGTRIKPGTYSPTAYLPNPHAPATNCAATCTSTASGIRVNDATRRAYLIASNPRLNQYGALAYIWPNPYGWTGPFVVADTGGAFNGVGRLDFYIFIGAGETWQQALARAYQWGPANQVKVSAAPIQPGGPSITTQPFGLGPADIGPGGTPPPLATPGSAPAAGCAVVDGEVGARVAQIAARYVGDGPSIPAFHPPSTSLEWCAWFATNVWRLAGVPIDVSFFSGAPYAWAQTHHALWKAVGQPAPSVAPPLGAALMYGTGPHDTNTSGHVNLVTKVNADGSFMLTGGNESNRVSLSGPCRLTATTTAHLRGPGCDSREVYAIAAPGGAA